MTREEAINVVKSARQYLMAGNPIWDVKKIDEAFSMAIEALQWQDRILTQIEDIVLKEHGERREE